MTRRTALVTGAAGGIGFAIARALAGSGFSVALNDLEEGPKLSRAVEELRSHGGEAHPVPADVADLSCHEALLDAAESALGPTDVLVNNAGVSVRQRGDLLSVGPESYDRCQAVNARAPFFLSQAFAKRLLFRGGTPDCHRCIINVTSSNAQAAAVSRGEYCVSKAAASMMTRLFAVRLGPENIGVYELQPGVIETDMTAPVRNEYLARIAEGLTVTPRIGTPSDVASVALAIASGQLAYCTGQAIQVDGGLLIKRF